MLAAAQDYEIGGMQLPCVVEMAANSFFSKAGVGIGGGGMLTSGNANLLMAHGTPSQKEVFARNEFAGRWFGTMCLTEPQAGSSLSDVATRAVPDGDDFESDPLGPRYRLRGNKMWISQRRARADREHRAPGAGEDPGRRTASWCRARRASRCSSCRRSWSTPTAQLTGERNDVALAGPEPQARLPRHHQHAAELRRRQVPPRGRAGAIGYLVGAPGEGLRCMFHMMNEARIAVGLGAAMLGYAGYEASLDYARNRPQGRPVGAAARTPTQPPVPHHRARRRQAHAAGAEGYCEGALALELYCARLVDEQHTGDAGSGGASAALLLEVLTPIAKSWPSEWCLEANSLAIQVHGGYGYTRDFPVEQYWRDNRLNMIHEGTHGIQALDLLGRKVVMDGGAGLKLLAARIGETIERAGDVHGLRRARQRARRRAAKARRRHEGGLGHRRARRGAGQRDAVPAGLRPRGARVDLARAGARRQRGSSRTAADDFSGQLAAARYFFATSCRDRRLAQRVVTRDATCREMKSLVLKIRRPSAARIEIASLGADLRRPRRAGSASSSMQPTARARRRVHDRRADRRGARHRADRRARRAWTTRTQRRANE